MLNCSPKILQVAFKDYKSDELLRLGRAIRLEQKIWKENKKKYSFSPFEIDSGGLDITTRAKPLPVKNFSEFFDRYGFEKDRLFKLYSRRQVEEFLFSNLNHLFDFSCEEFFHSPFSNVAKILFSHLDNEAITALLRLWIAKENEQIIRNLHPAPPHEIKPIDVPPPKTLEECKLPDNIIAYIRNIELAANVDFLLKIKTFAEVREMFAGLEEEDRNVVWATIGREKLGDFWAEHKLPPDLLPLVRRVKEDVDVSSLLEVTSIDDFRRLFPKEIPKSNMGGLAFYGMQ